MASWWEYEPNQTYYDRLRQHFEDQARRQAVSYAARQSLSDRGLMPDIATTTELQPWEQPKPDKPPEKASSGIFGRIKDTLGDVTEGVFRGPVDQPWDVFRPVQQALDWERENISKPLTKGITLAAAGAGAPLTALAERQSLGEAFATRMQRSEDQPDWLKATQGGVLETVLSPSTWLGAGEVGAGIKAMKMGFRASLFEPLFGRASIKGMVMAGGAQEPKAIEEMIARFSKIASSDVVGIKTTQDVFAEWKQNTGLWRTFRYAAGSNPKTKKLLETVGVRVFDDDAAILAANYARMRDVATSTGNAYESVIRQVAKSAGLNIADDGRLLDLPGQPYIEDVAANLSKYTLTPKAREAIKLMQEPQQTVRGLERAAGVKTPDRPGEGYFHRQAEAVEVDTAAGTQVDQLRPEVKRGYKATQSFQRPIDYATKAEGVANGVKYMPFWQAQRVRIEQGIAKIADSWLDAALSEIGKSPSQLVPEALSSAYQTSANRSAWLRAVGREVSRYLKTHVQKGAYKVPTQFDAKAVFRGAGAVPDDIKAIMAKLEEASNLPLRADRHLAFLDAAEDLKPLLEAAKSERQLSYSRVSLFKRGLTQELVGGTKKAPVVGGTAYPRFFRGKYYPEEIGAGLQRELPAVQGKLNPVENFVMKVNNNIRTVVANFDVSFTNIQGLIGGATNPKAFVQAWKNAVFFGYEDLIADAYKSGALDRFLRSGGHIASDQVGEFMFGRVFTKLPVIGKGFEFSNSSFTRFGNVLRLRMFEDAVKPGMSQEALTALARNVNLATGYSAGKPSNLETLALFAPRFLRSQLGLLSDAATKSDKAGTRAKMQIASLLTEGTILTLLGNKMAGQETDLDPTSANFMRIRAFGRDISVFGPWDTLMRAITITADKGPVEGGKYLARSKASPVMARVYDVFVTQQTFNGDKIAWDSPSAIIDSLAAEGQELLPISIQQSLFEQGIPTTPSQAAGAFIEFMGTKATPLTKWEKLAVKRDELAQQDYGTNWDALGPAAHWDLEQKYTEIGHPEATTDVGKYLEARREIGDKYYSNLQTLEKAVQSGELTIPQWREQYIEIRKLQAGAYQGLELVSQEAIAKLDSGKSDSNQQALQQLSNVFKESVSAWGVIDPERLDTNLAKIEAGWSSSQKAYVEDNTGYKTTPTLTKYREAQKVLESYWEVGNAVWQEFRAKRPDLAKYPTVDDYSYALWQQLISLGVPSVEAAQQLKQTPTLRAYEQLKESRRRVLRAKSPKTDALLEEFYGYTPLRFQRPSGGKTWRASGKRWFDTAAAASSAPW